MVQIAPNGTFVVSLNKAASKINQWEMPSFVGKHFYVVPLPLLKKHPLRELKNLENFI